MRKEPAQPNLSLIKGVECLQTVIAAQGPIGSREAARRLGFEHTRVNRLLGTLCALGLLEQTPDRRYRPGPGIHVLAAQSLNASGLLRAALPELRKFKNGKLDLALGVLWNNSVCYFFFRRPGMDTVSAISGRELFPAKDSSIGRIIMAKGKKEYALVRMNRDHASIAVGVGSPVFAGLALAGDRVTDREIPGLVERLKVAADKITTRLIEEELA